MLAAGWVPAQPATPTFADVPADALLYPYVETAVAHGLISSSGDGIFAPERTVMRGAPCQMIIPAAYPVQP